MYSLTTIHTKNHKIIAKMVFLCAEWRPPIEYENN